MPKTAQKKRWLVAVVIIVTAMICTIVLPNYGKKEENSPIRIATNPWPGYEFLHLADKKGFFKEEGVSIQLVRFSALDDARHAYERGQVDGMAVTFIEVLLAYENGSPSKIVLLTDYSNNNDVIIARKGIDSISALKGKKVGVEPAFGFYVWALALEKYGLSLDDVKLVVMNPLEALSALLSGKIDAVHTYPPYSTEILRHQDQVTKIFDSSEIPANLLGVVAMKPDIITRRLEDVRALRRAWDKTVMFAQEHLEEAIRIMAEVEGISPEEFAEALKGEKILNLREQHEIQKKGTIEQNIGKVSVVLKKLGNIKEDIPPKNFIVDTQDIYSEGFHENKSP